MPSLKFAYMILLVKNYVVKPTTVGFKKSWLFLYKKYNYIEIIVSKDFYCSLLVVTIQNTVEITIFSSTMKTNCNFNIIIYNCVNQ